MPRIAFIGGGSAKFVREVTVDMFSFDALREAEIVLMDIDRERAERSERLVSRIIRDRGVGASVSSTTSQREALDGADYVIVTIMVGGFEHYHSDIAIPEKYGVHQAVSDTIGPGGVFRVVRTAPVLRQIAADLAEIAPDAWILNYANPMAMNVWTLTECGHQRTVGLCHSIQHCYREISHWLGIPHEEIRYTAGGINHIDFYLTLEHNGRDIYPDLLAAADRIVADHPHERTRFELLKYLGHFPAEGAWHQSEYYPWFRKDQAAIDRLAAETYWGYNVDSKMYRDKTAEIEAQIVGERPIEYGRSLEYGAAIIDSLESGAVRTFYGNVPNRGLIENLPPQAAVEVPCLVDGNGIFPARVGKIPPQLAAAMMPHIAVHELAVAGVLTEDRTLIRQAIQADPLTGAILTLPQIEKMVDELFAENVAYMTGW